MNNKFILTEKDNMGDFDDKNVFIEPIKKDTGFILTAKADIGHFDDKNNFITPIKKIKKINKNKK